VTARRRGEHVETHVDAPATTRVASAGRRTLDASAMEEKHKPAALGFPAMLRPAPVTFPSARLADRRCTRLWSAICRRSDAAFSSSAMLSSRSLASPAVERPTGRQATRRHPSPPTGPRPRLHSRPGRTRTLSVESWRDSSQRGATKQSYVAEWVGPPGRIGSFAEGPDAGPWPEGFRGRLTGSTPEPDGSPYSEKAFWRSPGEPSSPPRLLS
jgi:hypothetical protein